MMDERTKCLPLTRDFTRFGVSAFAVSLLVYFGMGGSGGTSLWIPAVAGFGLLVSLTLRGKALFDKRDGVLRTSWNLGFPLARTYSLADLESVSKRTPSTRSTVPSGTKLVLVFNGFRYVYLEDTVGLDELARFLDAPIVPYVPPEVANPAGGFKLLGWGILVTFGFFFWLFY